MKSNPPVWWSVGAWFECAAAVAVAVNIALSVLSPQITGHLAHVAATL